MQRLFDKYIDNVTAYVNHEKLPHPVTGRHVEPDESFMRAIEEKFEPPITPALKDGFRNELVSQMASLLHKGKTFDYTTNDQLRRAVEKMIEDIPALKKKR